jgi:formyltetrahydrofolate-dependent phosphoribosylglycinamide formyltransferase
LLWISNEGAESLTEHVTIYTDGGSRGNPGPGAGAYVITGTDGKVICGKGVFIPRTTNNVAEYTGMGEGLKAAVAMGAKTVSVFSDSELMVKQINGEYKVKSPNLKDLYNDCMDILQSFSSWEVSHVYRESNKDADALANKAMDAKRDVVLKGKKPASRKGKGNKTLRIGVLLSGGGTTMVNIQKEIDAGSLNAEIVQVISSLSTVRGVDLAKGMDLPLEIVRKKDFSDVESFSDRIAEIMDAAKVDLIVQAGWLCLWRIPDNYENKVMNIHPALLPSFGGKGMWGHHVHEAVLKAGCKVSGCTVHFVTNEYDTGPIIVQKGCAVTDTKDADKLAADVFHQECKAYPQAIKLFAEGKLKVEGGIVKIS